MKVRGSRFSTRLLPTTPYSMHQFITRENIHTNSKFYFHITPNRLFKTSSTYKKEKSSQNMSPPLPISQTLFNPYPQTLSLNLISITLCPLEGKEPLLITSHRTTFFSFSPPKLALFPFVLP